MSAVYRQGGEVRAEEGAVEAELAGEFRRAPVRRPNDGVGRDAAARGEEGQ